MIQILWHGNILREYDKSEEEKALLNFKWYQGFLLPEKLEYVVG